MRSVLQVLKGKISKKHGDVADRAINQKPSDIPRLKTGSLALDFALGGGIPVGHMTMLRGAESSGKTTCALMTVARSQKLCANCLRPVDDLKVVEVDSEEDPDEVDFEVHATCDCYQNGLFVPKPFPSEYSNFEKRTMKQVDIEVVDDKTGKTKKKKSTLYKERIKRYEENSFEEFCVAWFDIESAFDTGWAESVGVDTRRLLLINPSSGEEAVDIYDELMKTGEIDLFVLDSIAAMTPIVEREADMTDHLVGVHAMMVNRFVRKMGASINQCWKDYRMVPTQVWINQERKTIGGWGDNSIMPGGEGQKFGGSVIVKLWSSKWESTSLNEDLKADFKIEIGKEVRINFRTIKNRTNTPRITGSFILRLVGPKKGQIDEFGYVTILAHKYGFYREEIQDKTKIWYVGEQEFKTKGGALAMMEEPDVFEDLKDAILGKMLFDKDRKVER